MDNIEELLLTEPYNTELDNYTYMPYNLWDKVPIGSIIKYIDRDFNIKYGGFLIKCIDNARVEKQIYVLKSGERIFNFKPFFYYVFYKKEENYTNEQKVIILSKKSRKKPTKQQLFTKLLSSL